MLEYRQELDMRRGVRTRLWRVRDTEGRRTRLTQRRPVSMDAPHPLALETTVVPVDRNGEPTVRPGLDGR
ncbi:hypothetical protein [Marinactinospora rubrisoli]|uniref:Glycoside hydrolase family 65 N-terminal domain-containing protein n=1 Tax=Marinactinospora rubrisoli TaxID=2715399 RepID=A0ABW2KMK7_9ACTN